MSDQVTHDSSAVLSGSAPWAVVVGDSLAVLAGLPSASVDAIITDPPYSSGGLFRADRARDTDSKYTQTEDQGRRPNFAGDNRDQRSWSYWCSLWIGECLRIAKPDGRLLIFSDWRQLPATTDAIQAGGWIWRGIVPWNKGDGTRPTPGGFRNQCEYIVWGSPGPLPMSQPGVGVWPGFYVEPVRQDDKHHQTGKPTRLLRKLVTIAPPGGVVLDPFAGSGTTGAAAIMEGRRCILIEQVPEYSALTRSRLQATSAGVDFRRPEQAALGLEPPA